MLPLCTLLRDECPLGGWNKEILKKTVIDGYNYYWILHQVYWWALCPKYINNDNKDMIINSNELIDIMTDWRKICKDIAEDGLFCNNLQMNKYTIENHINITPTRFISIINTWWKVWTELHELFSTSRDVFLQLCIDLSPIYVYNYNNDHVNPYIIVSAN